MGSVTIGNITVKPGSKAHGVLEVPNVYADGSAVEIPFIVINGQKPGKTLHLMVGQHGEEGIHPLEAIRRVFIQQDPKTLSGTLQFCLPNPIGFRRRTHFLTFDMRVSGYAQTINMNRVWPGNPDGSIPERIAYTIWNHMILNKADCVIDFHTGDGIAANPNWVAYHKGKGKTFDETEKLAKVFGTPYLGQTSTAETGFVGIEEKMVEVQCIRHGIPSFAPEGGILARERGEPRYGFDEISIDICVKGINNVMKALGMIEGKPELPKKQYVWGAIGERVCAKNGGVFSPSVKPCESVKKNDKLGIVYSPRTFEILETIVAPLDGIVWGMTGDPIVNAGEQILSVRKIIEVVENS